MINTKTYAESGLVRMERRLRLLSAAVAVLAAGFVAAFATGATSSSVPDFLVAKTFRLVDDGGSLRGVLETDEDGRVVLSVVSQDGKPATRLVLDHREPRLAVHDATGSAVPMVAPAARSEEPLPGTVSPAAAAPKADAPAPAATGKKGVVRWGGGDEEDDDAFDWAD